MWQEEKNGNRQAKDWGCNQVAGVSLLPQPAPLQRAYRDP